jgi:ABC-type amino acid transport substrate-binding protein
MQTHPRVSRPVLAVLAALTLFANGSGLCAEKAAPGEDRETLSISTEEAMQPRKDDLDGMIKRRLVRVLVVPNKTHYFMDKGTQRGGTYDGFRLIEQELNKKLDEAGKLEKKHLKVRFVFIPMGREQLLQALADGKGDVAAANLTVTPERLKRVDFTVPTLTGSARWSSPGPPRRPSPGSTIWPARKSSSASPPATAKACWR